MFIVVGGNPWPPPLNDSPENEATLDLIIGSQQHIPTQKFLKYPSPPPLLQVKPLASLKGQGAKFLGFFIFCLLLPSGSTVLPNLHAVQRMNILFLS